MRLAYTSDLHSDLCARNRELVSAMAERAVGLEPDVLIVAGDVAERADDVAWTLEQLAIVPGARLYLAGNHDLFVEGDPSRPETPTSRDKYERVLPETVRQAGFTYLGLEPFRLGRLAIVGVTGWYDFTLRDATLDSAVGLHSYRAGEWRGERAFDRGHVFWPRESGGRWVGDQPATSAGDWAGDEEICDAMLARLEAQLGQIQGAEAVLAAVHVLPFAELAVRGAFGDCAFFDAYLGSVRLGERLRRIPGLRAVVSGHLHRDADRMIDGIRAVARPVGDARRRSGGLAEVARDRIGLLEVQL